MRLTKNFILALAIASVTTPLAAEEIRDVVRSIDPIARTLTLEIAGKIPVAKMVQIEEVQVGMPVRATLDMTAGQPMVIVEIEPLLRAPLMAAPDLGAAAPVPPAGLGGGAAVDLRAQARAPDKLVQPKPGSAPASSQKFIVDGTKSQYLVRDVLGLPVRNQAEERLGWVHDLLANSDGRLVGVVISTGGFLGLGDRRIAVPLDDVVLDPDGEEVIVALARGDLEQAPDFRTTERGER
jgi:hypothetical protein